MRPWLVAFLASVAAVAGAAEIAGIKLDERTRLGTSEVVLNGAGLHKRLFFKVYVVGLYLTERARSPAGAFSSAGPKRVSITLLRDLPAHKLVDALKHGIQENSSLEEQRAVDRRVEELAANLMALRHGKEGDVITFDWLPDAGTLVALNGEPRGSAIPGDDVYRALLRVWLGDRPTSAGLKKALLGRID